MHFDYSASFDLSSLSSSSSSSFYLLRNKKKGVKYSFVVFTDAARRKSQSQACVLELFELRASGEGGGTGGHSCDPSTRQGQGQSGQRRFLIIYYLLTGRGKIRVLIIYMLFSQVPLLTVS